MAALGMAAAASRLQALESAAEAMRQSIAERKQRDPKTIPNQQEFDAVTANEERELAGWEALIKAEPRSEPKPVAPTGGKK